MLCVCFFEVHMVQAISHGDIVIGLRSSYIIHHDAISFSSRINAPE
jgi:hypothetical protein